MGRFTIVFAPLVLLGSVACSSGDDDDDSTQPKDSSVNDTGDNNTDSGVAEDSGVVADSGMQGPCNPYDGSGCSEADESCVFVLQTNMDQCRTLPMMNAFEAACSAALNNCAPGLTCADIGSGPLCYQVCDSANGAQCSGLMGMSNDYVCTGFQVGGANTIHGICVGQDLCNPAEKMAACMAGETCTQVGQMETGCLTAGTAMLNQTCSAQNNCTSGLICLDIGDGRQCYEGCDAMNACTAGTDFCQALQNIAWGICLPMGTPCQPLTMPCAAGMTCSILTGAAECTTSGNAVAGQGCDPNAHCVDGAVCALLQPPPATPLCYEPCDAMNACSSGTCQMLTGLTFGLCVP